MAEDAAQIVSELATNAILHATEENGSAFVLTIVERQDVLRIAVTGCCAAVDWGGQRGDFGRGLMIVDALADAWGTDVRGEAVTWWAEIWR